MSLYRKEGGSVAVALVDVFLVEASSRLSAGCLPEPKVLQRPTIFGRIVLKGPASSMYQLKSFQSAWSECSCMRRSAFPAQIACVMKLAR
jgi:hypothetical protein